jgi:nitrite reductase (NADH) large subunit
MRRASRRVLRLVAPLIEQAKVLAATMTGNKGPVYAGTVTASKLKIMGVDVFSAGDWSGQDAEPVRFEDRALGIYKKLTVRSGKLAGVILVGDTATAIATWNGSEAAGPHTAAAPPAVSAASRRRRARCRADVRQRDRVRVRRCHQGRDHRGHPRPRCLHALAAEGRHAREHRLRKLPGFMREPVEGGCAGLQRRVKERAVRCVPFSQDEIRDIIRSQKLRSVQDVLDIYGNGQGCEICKPALSYLIDVVWCGGHEEDRSARFINDRVHANIQKDGTFSVIPRIAAASPRPVNCAGLPTSPTSTRCRW